MPCWPCAPGPDSARNSEENHYARYDGIGGFRQIRTNRRAQPAHRCRSGPLDTQLNDLGAESLDLIEITMETETQFHIFLPDKSILETAVEVFGSDILEKDGYLTEEGKRLLLRRLPEADARAFQGEVAVKDLQHIF